MMRLYYILMFSLLTACASTRTVANADRVEEGQRSAQLSEVSATEALHHEQTEWIRYTEVVERITEEVEQPATAPEQILIEGPKPSPREPPTRTTERTTRTIEGAQRNVEAVINHSTIDTLSSTEQVAVEERISLDKERESDVSKSLQWLAVIAICVVAVCLFNFLKKFKK